MKEAMAKGYGDALFEIGIEQNKLEEFRKQCDLVKATLNDEFMSLFVKFNQICHSWIIIPTTDRSGFKNVFYEFYVYHAFAFLQFKFKNFR